MNTEPQPDPTATSLPISSGAADELLHTRMMDPPATPGGIGRIDRFEISRLLGEGGMGQVLLAREPVTDSLIAIKIVKPCYSADTNVRHRFLAEARHMYQLSHPNVLRVLEVCDRQNGPYFVMPYIQDGSLAERLRRKPPLTPPEIVALATQIAKALAYAHERGIIHRDLKPANVLLDADGHAYLTDFGLARTIFNDTLVNAQQQYVEGTAPYMSPAVAAGKAEDTRCDIYSFGALLYEMLAGQPPYQGGSPQAVILAIAAGPPPAIATLNPSAHAGLAAIAQYAMARELHDRYASMADVLADLGRVAAGQQPLGPHGQATRPGGRKLVAIAAMVAVVLAALGGFAWWQSQRSDTRMPPIAKHLDPSQPAALDTTTHGQPDEGDPTLNPAVETASTNATAPLSQGPFSYTVDDGKATIVKYDGPGGEVTIPDMIGGKPVIGIGQNAFRFSAGLDRVLIPDSVISIGRAAFSNPDLMKVRLPENQTSIDIEAFAGSGLTDVSIPAQLTTISRGAFYNCTNLTSITAHPENPAYASVDGVLFNKMQTDLIQCPAGKTGGVIVPEGVTTIGARAFQHCVGLTSVTIPPSVTHIETWAFANCNGLTRVLIPESVRWIRYSAFRDCRSLTGLYFAGDAPHSHDEVFGGSDIATVYYRPGTKGWGETFGGRPTKVWEGDELPGEAPLAPDLTGAKTEGPFSYTVADGKATIVKYNGPGGEVTIPVKIEGIPVVHIGDAAFRDCQSLTTVRVPDGVIGIGDFAFYQCRALASVELPPSLVRIGSQAFRFCSALAAIDLPAGLTSLGRWVFDNCTSLRSVAVPAGVTVIEDRTFIGCTALVTVGIPAGVTRIGSQAFQGCSALAEVTVPAGVTSVAGRAFEGCTSLHGVYFQGDAPRVEQTTFVGSDNATVYYRAGTKGWGETFGGRPTASWIPTEKTVAP